jgi:hypothetical protein
MTTPALSKREALRAEMIATIPRWYSPIAHIGLTTSIGVGLSLAALLQIHNLNPLELFIIPAMFIIANASEWRAHRDLLHKRQPWATPLYDQHTPIHHKLYLTSDMEIRSPRELNLVLMPPFGIAIIFVATLPVAVALWYFGQHNLAALFIITTQMYVVSYEWLHMSYHLPRTTLIGRNPLIRKLARHHAIHHAPERMNVWNLNVNFPLWDWVRGTIYRGDDVEQLLQPEPPTPASMVPATSGQSSRG